TLTPPSPHRCPYTTLFRSQLVRIEDRIVPTGIVPTPQTSGGAEIAGLTRVPPGNAATDFYAGVSAANPLAPSQIVTVGIGVTGGWESTRLTCSHLLTSYAA